MPDLESFKKNLDEIVDEFREALTEVPGEKHGHWEAYYVCSMCGETSRTIVARCPFCHARMDGKDI